MSDPQGSAPPQQYTGNETAIVPPANPPAGNYAQTQNQPSGGGGIETKWIMTPRGILRFVEFVFSIVAFGCMSSLTGYSNYSEYQWLVACGVLSFVYTLVLMVTYLLQNKVDSICGYQPIVELILDGVFVVLWLSAGAAAATRCTKTIFTDPNTGTSYSMCQPPSGASSTDENNLRASIVFAFFCMALFIASTIFSYLENQNEERKTRSNANQ